MSNLEDEAVFRTIKRSESCVFVAIMLAIAVFLLAIRQGWVG